MLRESVGKQKIFIDMFASKRAHGPHNLARFPSWDLCITPGYWAWYLNALPTSGSLIRSLFYAFMARGGYILARFFFCAVPVFVAEHGLGSCRYPSLCSGSRSPGCDTSFELPFIAWVAFRLDFMAGIILHFIFIACVASSCFIAYVAFSSYGMCRLHVGFYRRVSPSR